MRPRKQATAKGYTITVLAREFGIDRKTLEKVLANTSTIGEGPRGGRLYSGKSFLEAWLSYHQSDRKNLDAERARLIFHQANIAELDEETKRGNLVEVEEVQSTLANAAIAIRRVIMSSNLPQREQDSILAELKELGANG